MRSTSRSRSTRNVGADTSHPSDAGRIAQPERLENPHHVGVRHVEAEQARQPRPAADAAACRRAGADTDRRSVPTTRPAPMRCISSIARCRATTGALTSAPRSNRDEASVFSPSRLLVRRTDAGLKYALSNATTLVASETSERRPPMTPATACACCRIGDDQHVAVELSLDAVERRDRFALVRTTNPKRVLVERVEIERVHRMPELHQHVVGDVDEGADRPDAGRLEPGDHPGGRGRGGNGCDRRRIARTQLGVLERDLQAIRFARFDFRESESCAFGSTDGRRTGRS